MRDTWYVLEDGSVVDPSEVAPDQDGVLRHKDGVAVDMRGDAPRSRNVDPAEERAKAASSVAGGGGAGAGAAGADAGAGAAGNAGVAAKKSREMKAGKGSAKYETR